MICLSSSQFSVGRYLLSSFLIKFVNSPSACIFSYFEREEAVGFPHGSRCFHTRGRYEWASLIRILSCSLVQRWWWWWWDKSEHWISSVLLSSHKVQLRLPKSQSSLFLKIYLSNSIWVTCSRCSDSRFLVQESESESHSVSCLTLCDPMDCIVHGILQARMLEWVAVPFSRGSSWPRDWTEVSRIASRFFTSWATREAPKYWSG